MAFAALISTICLGCNMAQFMDDGMTHGFRPRKGTIICGSFHIGYLGTFLSAACFACGFALHALQWRSLKNHHQQLLTFYEQTAIYPVSESIPR